MQTKFLRTDLEAQSGAYSTHTSVMQKLNASRHIYSSPNILFNAAICQQHGLNSLGFQEYLRPSSEST